MPPWRQFGGDLLWGRGEGNFRFFCGHGCLPFYSLMNTASLLTVNGLALSLIIFPNHIFRRILSSGRSGLWCVWVTSSGLKGCSLYVHNEGHGCLAKHPSLRRDTMKQLTACACLATELTTQNMLPVFIFLETLFQSNYNGIGHRSSTCMPSIFRASSSLPCSMVRLHGIKKAIYKWQRWLSS